MMSMQPRKNILNSTGVISNIGPIVQSFILVLRSVVG